MKRLLLSDLDGTLLNKYDVISNFNAQAIKKWQINDEFMIASGRYYTDIKHLLTQANINAGMIALNGAIILDKNYQIVNYHSFHQQLLLRQIITFCEQYQMIYIVYGLRHVWSRFYPHQLIMQLSYLGQKRSSSQNEILQYMKQYYDEIYRQFTAINMPFNKFNQDEILHIEIFDHREQLLNKLIEKFSNKLAITTASPVDLEISPPNISKGMAINELSQAYQQIIAIGDGDNDVTMLKQADIGIVMANGSLKAKQVANQLTADNNHNGVAKAIMRLLNE